MKRIVCLVLAVLLALPLTAVADDALETESFVSVRTYNIPEALGYVPPPDDFLDEIRHYDGFRGYFHLYSGDKSAAVNLWATEEQALESNEIARSGISERYPSMLQQSPRFVVGTSAVGFVDAPDGIGDEYLQLYASLRIYDGFTDSEVSAFVTLVEEVFQPLIRETEGFFAHYVIHDSAETLVTVSIFQEQVRDVVDEYLSAFLPDPASIVSGHVRLAALAGVNDAANLVELPQP